MDYFYGEGSMLWETKSQLLIQEINVTEYLLKYRQRNIKLATLNNNLSDLQQLSLSYVFPANKFDEGKCAFKHLQEEERQRILDNLYAGLIINRATSNAVLYCKDVADAILMRQLTMAGSLISPLESVTRHLSRRGRLCQATKADENQRGMRKSTWGVRNPISLGLLVEGYSCTLYMMDIKDEGVYIPVQIKRFFLPEVRENLVNVPSVVEGFLFVKEKLLEFEEKLKEKKSKVFVDWKKGTYYAKSE
ncbi:hypothetical protein G6F37_001482 [Rhizopus arrhizus]|nr:hypothetical protein G6F38_003709 [Rhizopus arrhizus]KAG1163165.1 hypothetical protein G6F37_001482 [Rhizopus arrhizus]